MFDELAEQIQFLTDCLESKSADLELAAEIGSRLVEENGILSAENEQLKQGASNFNAAEARLLTLEGAHQDVIFELQKEQDQNQKLLDSIRSSSEAIKRKHDQESSIHDELSTLQDHVKLTSIEKEKWINEKSEIVIEKQQLAAALSKAEMYVFTSKSDILDLEHQLDVSLIEKQALILVNETEIIETRSLKEKITELEEILEASQSYKGVVDELTLTIDQLSAELEWSRDANQKLTSRISVLDPNCSGNDEDVGGKSLLSEIEDRRLELVKQHDNLTEKHAGLAQTHSVSLYRQQKMKHHIARLSQLTNTDATQEKIQLLEDSLAQCESENLELEKRIELLQSKQYSSNDRLWDARDVDIPISDSQRLQSLDFRIQQLIDECESLKTSNQTLRLIKAGETDKLHQITSLLLDRERELDYVKRDFANAKFELDELLLSLKEKESLPIDVILESPKENIAPLPTEKVICITNESLQGMIIPISCLAPGRLFPTTPIKTTKPQIVQRSVKKSQNIKSPFGKGVLQPLNQCPGKTIKVDRSQVDQEQCKQQ